MMSLAVLLVGILSVCFVETSAAPSDTSYNLVWSDEFSSGGQPNSLNWGYETGAGGWGNNELEYYTSRSTNAYVGNGVLTIQGQAESYQDSSYTSARIKTAGKVQFYLGYVEFRAKVANMQNGLWPAGWMLGSFGNTQWPQCGEIDVLEQVNGASNSIGAPTDYTNFGTLHYQQGGQSASGFNPQQSGGQVQTTGSIYANDYHLYSVYWTTTSIQFLVDGNAYYTVTFNNQVNFDTFSKSSNPFYFILNLAIGGNFPNTAPANTFQSAQFQIDYVRLYQKNDGVSTLTSPAATTIAKGGPYMSTTAVATQALPLCGAGNSAYYGTGSESLTANRFPTQVPSGGATLNLNVNYNAAGYRFMHVDLCTASFSFCANGIAASTVASGTGTVSVPLTYGSLPASSNGYVWSVWSVSDIDEPASQPYLYKHSWQIYNAGVGSTLVNQQC